MWAVSIFLDALAFCGGMGSFLNWYQESRVKSQRIKNQESRVKKSRVKNQESRVKVSRIKSQEIKSQESRSKMIKKWSKSDQKVIKNDQKWSRKNKQSSIHRIRISIWFTIRIRIILNFSIAFLSFLSSHGWIRSSFPVYFCFPDSLYSLVLVFKRLQFIGMTKGWFDPKESLLFISKEMKIQKWHLWCRESFF